MLDSELDKFLSLAQTSGELESTSEFTINSLKARQKLAGSQLPQEGLWLVKLVQAAVSCGARRADISFRRREVEFCFEVEEWPWEPRQVLQDLLSGVLPSETPLSHLFAGLRNSLFEDTVEAEWSIAKGDEVFKVRFHSEGTEVIEEPGTGQGGFRLVTSRPPRWPGFTKAAGVPLQHLLRRTADEFMAVHSYCWPCPIPLTLDGRPLETRYVPSPSIGDERFVQRALGAQHLSMAKMRPVLLAKRGLVGEQALHLPWEVDPGKLVEKDFEGHFLTLRPRAYFGQTWMDWPLPEETKIGGYLLLLYGGGAQSESRIEFLCDGVVVDTLRLPWPEEPKALELRKISKAFTHQFGVGVRVLLPVNSSQLDLSHFRVREPQVLLETWQPQILAALRQTCRAVLQYSKDFKPGFVNQPRNVIGEAFASFTRFSITVHPVFNYLTKRGFRKEVESLLKSLEAQAD